MVETRGGSGPATVRLSGAATPLQPRQQLKSPLLPHHRLCIGQMAQVVCEDAAGDEAASAAGVRGPRGCAPRVLAPPPDWCAHCSPPHPPKSPSSPLRQSPCGPRPCSHRRTWRALHPPPLRCPSYCQRVRTPSQRASMHAPPCDASSCSICACATACRAGWGAWWVARWGPQLPLVTKWLLPTPQAARASASRNIVRPTTAHTRFGAAKTVSKYKKQPRRVRRRNVGRLRARLAPPSSPHMLAEGEEDDCEGEDDSEQGEPGALKKMGCGARGVGGCSNVALLRHGASCPACPMCVTSPHCPPSSPFSHGCSPYNAPTHLQATRSGVCSSA